jgi:signal transduction histidine kinase
VSLMGEELQAQNITIMFHLDETQPLVLGNTIQLEQVFVNLLTNARDAMQTADNRVVTIRSHMVDDTAVSVEIADTGTGIPASVVPRIFDPFFTTKAVGQGTGLGLSITYGIVKEHRGTVEVRTEEGAGTIFILQFPSARMPIESNVG